jgi:hypothetical protein
MIARVGIPMTNNAFVKESEEGSGFVFVGEDFQLRWAEGRRQQGTTAFKRLELYLE